MEIWEGHSSWLTKQALVLVYHYAPRQSLLCLKVNLKVVPLLSRKNKNGGRSGNEDVPADYHLKNYWPVFSQVSISPNSPHHTGIELQFHEITNTRLGCNSNTRPTSGKGWSIGWKILSTNMRRYLSNFFQFEKKSFRFQHLFNLRNFPVRKFAYHSRVFQGKGRYPSSLKLLYTGEKNGWWGTLYYAFFLDSLSSS